MTLWPTSVRSPWASFAHYPTIRALPFTYFTSVVEFSSDLLATCVLEHGVIHETTTCLSHVDLSDCCSRPTVNPSVWLTNVDCSLLLLIRGRVLRLDDSLMLLILLWHVFTIWTLFVDPASPLLHRRDSLLHFQFGSPLLSPQVSTDSPLQTDHTSTSYSLTRHSNLEIILHFRRDDDVQLQSHPWSLSAGPKHPLVHCHWHHKTMSLHICLHHLLHPTSHKLLTGQVGVSTSHLLRMRLLAEKVIKTADRQIAALSRTPIFSLPSQIHVIACCWHCSFFTVFWVPTMAVFFLHGFLGSDPGCFSSDHHSNLHHWLQHEIFVVHFSSQILTCTVYSWSSWQFLTHGDCSLDRLHPIQFFTRIDLHPVKTLSYSGHDCINTILDQILSSPTTQTYSCGMYSLLQNVCFFLKLPGAPALTQTH